MTYNVWIQLVNGWLPLLARFSPRVKKWWEGRQGWQEKLTTSFRKTDKVLWMHVASLGEFEQGRPLIEVFRQRYPRWQIVLTFFSPSGFEVRKNYPYADCIAYLPLDTPQNARLFVQLIEPDLAIFVKYEFWKNFLTELKNKGVSTLLVSANFRVSQPFFRWWGQMWRDMLKCFTHIFVQDEIAEKLLQKIGFQNVTIAGDTRVDRVLRVVETPFVHPNIEKWVQADARPVFVVGSSWAADEAVFLPYFQKNNFQDYKMILAPHDVGDLKRWDNVQRTLRLSAFDAAAAASADILIIDNVGMLNALYRYGTWAYVGGGFGRGIHNILEPAAYGMPVIFGPTFQKFVEARQLIQCGGAFSVRNAADFERLMRQLSAKDIRNQAAAAAQNWILKQSGATQKIMQWIDYHVIQST